MPSDAVMTYCRAPPQQITADKTTYFYHGDIQKIKKSEFRKKNEDNGLKVLFTIYDNNDRIVAAYTTRK